MEGRFLPLLALPLRPTRCRTSVSSGPSLLTRSGSCRDLGGEK